MMSKTLAEGLLTINTFVVTYELIYLSLFYSVMGLLIGYASVKLIEWAKKARKGAYLFMLLFPAISIFPIPPVTFQNIDKAKQEQRKKQRNRRKK